MKRGRETLTKNKEAAGVSRKEMKPERLGRVELLSCVEKLQRENEELSRQVRDLAKSLDGTASGYGGAVNAGRIAELLKQEKYMRLLLESSPEVILLLDRDGRIAYCTNALLRVANIEDPEMIIGKEFKELYGLFGDEGFVRRGILRFEKVKEERETIVNDVLIDFAGKGESRMYSVQSSPMLNEDGDFDGVFVMYYDTTDVRNAEADESARLMLDAIPMACSIWDEEGNMLDCNEEALRMFGLSDKSDYLKYFYDLSPPFQPDGMPSREKAESMDEMALDTGYLRFEWMHRTLKGEDLPVETTLVRIPWNDGYRLATYSRDLREIRENEEKMREADERNRELEVRTRAAQVASEAKSRFLASMSHEIRTPMNAIIGMSDLMRTDNLDETQRGYFDDIRKMSRTLLGLINDILDISKIEAGKMDLTPSHFNLFELFDNICSMNHFIAETKELKFTSYFAEDVPHVVYGDEMRVRQVISNIVNNAIKYTKEGAVEFRVQKEAKNGRNYIAFVVKDTGIGIKKDDFPRLFDAFQQFDGGANRGIVGTGLGLSIAKNLVTMMGGEIGLESEHGRGSVFTVLLPLDEGDPDMIEKPCLSAFSIAAEGVRVLVVDDNRINQKVAVAYLAKHNIRADTASSGQEALLKIEGKPYDLVFMDHMMPEMDGIEATRRIRSLPGRAGEKIRIIALSANAVMGARESFLEAGMDDFIAKTIDPKELNAVLIKWLPPRMVTCTIDPAAQSVQAPTDSASGESSLAIDAKAGLENSAGDEALYGHLVNIFLSDHSWDHDQIEEALRKGDRALAARLVHTLKSAAALMGAKKLRAAALAVEKKLTEGAPSAEETARLREELDLAVSEMKNFAVSESVSGGETGMESLDKSRAISLVNELEPLLSAGNAGSLDLVQEIMKTLSPLGVKSALLAKQIEDFDFYSARETLMVLERALKSDNND
jgi:signal transduction histidine kinase/CheY-like chemotaxis protein